MPRPNVLRTLHSEAGLARRIAHEREVRGWSYEGLAKRLTDVGCAIQGSAIYKIERGTPRRRITVDELVGFSQVFDIDVPELLLAPELVDDRQIREVVQGLAWAVDGLHFAVKRANEQVWAIHHLLCHPDHGEMSERLTLALEPVLAPVIEACANDGEEGPLDFVRQPLDVLWFLIAAGVRWRERDEPIFPLGGPGDNG